MGCNVQQAVFAAAVGNSTATAGAYWCWERAAIDLAKCKENERYTLLVKPSRGYVSLTAPLLRNGGIIRRCLLEVGQRGRQSRSVWTRRPATCTSGAPSALTLRRGGVAVIKFTKPWEKHQICVLEVGYCYAGAANQRKCQLLHPATPYYPFPRGKFHTRGNIWGFTMG